LLFHLFGEKVSPRPGRFPYLLSSAMSHHTESEDDENEDSEEEYSSNKRLRLNEDGDEEEDETDLRSQDDRES
jgi:hypothetical protein